MFSGCNNLTYLDLSNFNVSNVIYFESIFSGCYKLETIKGIKNLIVLAKKNKNLFKDCRIKLPKENDIYCNSECFIY